MIFFRHFTVIPKLINYSCSSYPTRASNSGQVDEFRNPMKNELKTRSCLKPVFETISNTDLLLTLNVTAQVINWPKQKLKAILFVNLNSRSMMETSCFGSLSTLLYTSVLKWH